MDKEFYLTIYWARDYIFMLDESEIIGIYHTWVAKCADLVRRKLQHWNRFAMYSINNMISNKNDWGASNDICTVQCRIILGYRQIGYILHFYW